MSKEAIKTVGFIGTGLMGFPIASKFLDHNLSLVVYNRTKSKAEELLKRGALWAESPEEVCKQADIVFTMLGFPEDVEDVYLGDKGLLSAVHAGQYLIDLTTSDTELAHELYEAAAIKDVHFIDGPVTGGVEGAEAGCLTIMLGASEETVAPILTIIEMFSAKQLYFDEAGQGMRAKACNQIALGAAMMGMAESLVFAEQAGLDSKKIYELLMSGTAASSAIEKLGSKALAEDFKPGFYVEHFLKDLGLALNDAMNLELSLPGTETVYHLYDLLENLGGSKHGTQAIKLLYAPEDVAEKHGLDYKLLGEEFDGQFEDEHDHDHNHDHHHNHHHEHDESSSLKDYPYFSDDDFYSNN